MSTAVAPPRRRVGSVVARRGRAVPLPLVVLLAIAGLQGLAWATFTAPLQGPDEPAHAAYAQLLAETGHGPKRDSGDGSVSTEMARALAELNLSAIIGHAEGRPDSGGTAAFERRAEQLADDARQDGTGPNAVAQNPPLYYAYTALAYRLSPDTSILGRLYAMRLATVALFVVTVLLTWLFAGELFASRWPQLLTTALVALQPKLGSMAGLINADSLLYAVSTGFLWASVRLILRGPTLGGVALVAAFAAAGPLTHGRGFALLPPALLAVGLSFVGARLDRRTLVRLTAAAIGILLAAIVVAALWTRARTGGQAFGGEVAQGTTSGGSIRQLLSYVMQFYFGPWSFLQPLGPPYGYRQMYIETFFGSFVSLDVNWRTFVVDLLQIGSAIGLAAFLGTVLRRWPAVVRHWRLWALAAGTFVALAALLHISAYRDLSGGGTDPLLTGRYLLPCVALYALAIAWVCHSLPRILGAALGTALLACSLLLSFGGLGLTGLRFYA